MSGARSSGILPNPAAREPRRFAAALWLAALVLPFHPLWVDFEQVRRGLLLLLAGTSLILLPSLRPVRGERAALGFVGFLLLCGLLRGFGDAFLRDARTPASFQVWEAVTSLAHWIALGVALRLGARWRDEAPVPFAALLLTTSLFGLLQRTGLAEVAGYGVEREPVSVFGNGNVASEWTAVAGMVVAVLCERCTGRRRALLLGSLVAATAYLVVNGSRSGLIALPIGLVLLAVLRRKQAPWAPLLAALAGALLGMVLHSSLPRPEPIDPAAATAELQRGTNTLQVRFEIAKGTTRLFGESPIFGHGPGQFAVHYPRFRSSDEIELSSHGRRFATEVRTAHDDWLELLVEGGLPALVLFAALLFVLQREQRAKANLLPLFVLLLLMLVRSPLGNAPAIAAALWLCGEPREIAPVAAWRRPLAVVLGLGMLLLGFLPVAANCAITSFQRPVPAGQLRPIEAAARAAWWMPYEPRWLQLLAQSEMPDPARGHVGNLAAARRHAAAAVALRPFDPQLYELLVEVLVHGKAFDQARTLVRFALSIDPVHPELRMWNSWLAMQRGAVGEAIAAVADQPHARLREQLAEHFAALASASGNDEASARFRAEHHFVAAIDGLGDKRPERLEATKQHVKELTVAMQQARVRDARPLVLGALHFLDRGMVQDVIDYGRASAKQPSLQPYQRALLGAQLERLQQFEAWQPFLDAR